MANVTDPSIIRLLKQILERPGMTREKVAQQVELPVKNGAQAVHDVLRRPRMIHVPLADWILSQTVYSGDPIERALADLRAAGMSEHELQTIHDLVLQLLGKKPQGTTIRKDEGHTIYEPPHTAAGAVGEAPPPYAPISKKPKRVNRRSELATFPITSEAGPGIAQIPRWEAVAAGFGEDLQKSEEFTYIRELPYWQGVHSVLVRGDSMEDTLHPGDLILVQPFPNGGIELPPRGTDPKNSKKQLQRLVPDDELYILNLNDSGPTVKRVQYHGDLDWKLLIVADNGLYRPKPVTAQDKVVFYAKVIGIGEKPGGGKKYGVPPKF